MKFKPSKMYRKLFLRSPAVRMASKHTQLWREEQERRIIHLSSFLLKTILAGLVSRKSKPQLHYMVKPSQLRRKYCLTCVVMAKDGASEGTCKRLVQVVPRKSQYRTCGLTWQRSNARPACRQQIPTRTTPQPLC